MSIIYPSELWVVCLRSDQFVSDQTLCFDSMEAAIEYAHDGGYIARYVLKAPGTGTRVVKYGFDRDKPPLSA